MKNYTLIALLMLIFAPGCFTKKNSKVTIKTKKINKKSKKNRGSYAFSGDTEEFVLEDDLDYDAFGEGSGSSDSGKVKNSDFDWDNIAYDDQSLDPVQFDFDSTKIKSSEKYKLKGNARIIKNELKVDKNLRVVVKGHSCKIAKSELYNRAISQERADNVAKFYIDHGVDKERVNTVGYGATQLLTDADGRDAQSVNRRVETELVVKD